MTRSEFRKNMGKMMDKVFEKGDALVIIGPKGKRIIIKNLTDDEEKTETEYLLSSKTNAERLRESVQNIREGKNLITLKGEGDSFSFRK